MRAGRRAGAEAGSRAFAALRGRGLRGRGGGWPAGSPGAIVEGKGALPRSASVRGRGGTDGVRLRLKPYSPRRGPPGSWQDEGERARGGWGTGEAVTRSKGSPHSRRASLVSSKNPYVISSSFIKE